ncbi:MAG: hypothetical protein JNG84_14595 [Archangium sp.]|nr:hypothetical protein [Archangium sp.]
MHEFVASRAVQTTDAPMIHLARLFATLLTLHPGADGGVLVIPPLGRPYASFSFVLEPERPSAALRYDAGYGAWQLEPDPPPRSRAFTLTLHDGHDLPLLLFEVSNDGEISERVPSAPAPAPRLRLTDDGTIRIVPEGTVVVRRNANGSVEQLADGVVESDFRCQFITPVHLRCGHDGVSAMRISVRGNRLVAGGLHGGWSIAPPPRTDDQRHRALMISAMYVIAHDTESHEDLPALSPNE